MGFQKFPFLFERLNVVTSNLGVTLGGTIYFRIVRSSEAIQQIRRAWVLIVGDRGFDYTRHRRKEDLKFGSQIVRNS